MLEPELARGRAGEGGGELGHVLRNGEQALHDCLPHRDEIAVAERRELVRVPEPIVVAWRPAHLLPVHDREHRLRGQDVGQPGGEGGARRRLECEARSRQAAVPEQIEGAEPRVDQRGRVAWDELASRAERPRDRKSTRLNSQSRLHLVCRLLLEKKTTQIGHILFIPTWQGICLQVALFIVATWFIQVLATVMYVQRIAPNVYIRRDHHYTHIIV